MSSARAFAVVPAAGRSVRMGTAKLLLPWGDDGRTLIEHVLSLWRSSGVTQTVVTTHPDDVHLAEICRVAGAKVVVPTLPPPDMKASVAAALEHLRTDYHPTHDEVWLVAPADLPHLSAAVIQQLLEHSRARRDVILRPAHNGKAGHPTLFPWSAAAEMHRIPADRGLDWLCETLRCELVEVGPACLAADVDTPDDYRRLRDR